MAFVVGNTAVSWAVLARGRVQQSGGDDLRELRRSLRPDLEKIAEQYGGFERPSLVASVNPAGLERFLSFLAKTEVPRPLLAGKDFPISIKMDVEAPEKVGVDRLLGALAAWRQVRGPCITVDCGTAITVNAVSKQGVFLGGAILPGLHLMVKSLSRGTALLPEFLLEDKSWPPVGKNTEAAMAVGVFYGAAGAIARLVKEARAVIGRDAPVTITGGGSVRLLHLLPRSGPRGFRWEPALVPRGLFLAYQAGRKP